MTPVKAILAWCLANDLQISSVDSVSREGTWIYINGVNGSSAWISVLDSGKHVITLSQHGDKTDYVFNHHSLEMTRRFLKEKAA